MKKSTGLSAQTVATFAVLFALVVLLQLFGGYIRIGTTSLNFVLVPIVLGGILLGPIAGLLLGLTSGVIVLLCGVFGMDGFTLILVTDHPFITALTCIGKGVASGFVPALIYKLLKKKNEKVGLFIASALAPIINTGLFIIGALFMSDTLAGNFLSDGQTVLYFLIIVCAGVNFLVEFAINLVLSPSLYRVIKAIDKKPSYAEEE
jgi:uncharacterized membrane protein